MRFDATYIRRMADEIRDMLGDDFDAETFVDTLDGETDAADIADRLIAEALDAEALAEAIKAQENALRLRRDRITARGAAMRGQMLGLLDAMAVKKLERPRATIARRAGSMSVQITNEADIPSQLCTVRTVTAPDKKAIREQIEAGEAVPGAELVRGEDSVTLRVL